MKTTVGNARNRARCVIGCAVVLLTAGQAMAARWKSFGRYHRPAVYRPAPTVIVRPPLEQILVVPVDPVKAAQADRLRAAERAAIAAGQNQRNAVALVGVDERVVAFLRKRIDDGSADAATALAQRHEQGQGVPTDPAEARRLYRLAAEGGSEEAQFWLRQHP